MDAQEIRALIEMFEQSSLTELTLERGGVRLTLRREGRRAQGIAPAPQPHAPGTPSELTEPHPFPPLRERRGAGGEVSATNGHVVTSPLVGTFYRRPAPTEPPYVEIGDRVEKGDTLCIIEAMKVMNEIKAEHAGIVEKIFVEDGKPVEYGQPLMVIRP